MKTIYLAGSITGLSYDEAFKSFDDRATILKAKYDVIHPLLAKEYLRTEKKLDAKGYEQPPSRDRAIFGRDKWAVRQADIVFADLTLAKEASIGTSMEIAWANLLGKLVITVMQDDNIHQHAFITEGSDILFSTTEEAIEYLLHVAN